MLGIGSKKRRQDCLLLTEDGRILDIKLSVVKEYIAEHKTAEAWGLFPDACIPERGTNRLFQVITERDCAPLSLNGHKENGAKENGAKENYSKRMKLAMSRIAQESASAARASIQKKSQQNKIAETVQLLAIIFGIFFCLLVLVWAISSGGIHLPGGGGGGGIF